MKLCEGLKPTNDLFLLKEYVKLTMIFGAVGHDPINSVTSDMISSMVLSRSAEMCCPKTKGSGYCRFLYVHV